ncbi:hypothetical protein BDY21DRAFT_363004 [Lineolata rhizophorae]|uniref:Rhodopsin domain-containing protein n=1 Tax=Lineolata rhizophorae TaxID=578093 RepID=A0A6A6P4U8_9PEZI|nr:hypothetical protein BDY21DRAFT_363004 [Lineolata rhizophorae]
MSDSQGETAQIREDSVGPTVTAVAIIFAVLSAITIFLRMFSRSWVVGKVGPDDILMCIATLLAWAFIAATILAVNHGLGDHIEAVMARGTDNLVSYSQIVWLSSIFYNACLGFIKMSVLALYMRLGDRLLRKLAMIMFGVVACQCVANVASCIFQCDPIPAAWDITITEKRCIDINAFYLANAACNIFTDLLTYTLPIKMIFHLQIPQKQKIALGVILSLGLLACISSIIRITFIPKMLTSPDATYVISDAMYWSVIETNIGILAASIPSFKALAKRYLPRILGEYSSGNKTGQSGNKLSSRAFQKLGFGKSDKPATDTAKSVGGHGDVLESHKMRALSMTKENISMDKNGIQTRVEQDVASNSSEERLNVPDGKIMARTHITTQVEGNSDSGSFFFKDDDDNVTDPHSRV